MLKAWIRLVAAAAGSALRATITTQVATTEIRRNIDDAPVKG
jgi:hypothetical protein